MAGKNVIYNAEVQVGVDTKELKKGVKDAKKAASDLAGNKVEVPVDDKDVTTLTDKLKRMRAHVKTFALEAKQNAGLIKPSAYAADLYKQWELAEDAAQGYRDMIAQVEAQDPNSDKLGELNEGLAKAEQIAADLNAELSSMPTIGTTGLFQDTGAPSFVKNMRAYISELRGRFASLARGMRDGLIQAGEDGTAPLRGRLAKLTRAFASATSSVRRLAVEIKNDLVAGGKKALGKLAQKFNEVRKNTSAATFGLKGFKRGMLSAVGIKGIARLGLLTAALYTVARGAREGMGNLMNYSASTRNSIMSLQGALLTMKNAFATAFAPLLSVVIPILKTIVAWVTAAATALAHFFGALTGKKSIAVAKPMASVADSAGAAAGNTGKADKAAKAYKRTLMGFDQINKLDEPTKDAGSGGGGGGGAGGGAGADMFETVDTAAWAKTLVKKLKEAWKKGDFTEIGEMLGRKLNEALKKIPWNKIKATARKLASSIATFLNGFIKATNWKLVGKTFAQGINTIIEFGYTFVKKFKWKKFGKAIGDAVNGFFLNLDFAKAGKTFSGFVTGLLDTAVAAVKAIKWEQIATNVVKFLTNIDWIKILGKATNLIVNLAAGLLEAFRGAVLEIGRSLSKKIGEWLGGGGKDDKAKFNVTVGLIKGWTKLPSWLTSIATSAKTTLKKGWKKLSSAYSWLTNISTKVKTTLKKGWTKLPSWLTDITVKVKAVLTKPKGGAKGGGGGSVWGQAGGGLYSNGRWKPITTAATGGAFNTGQVFLAREAGPELVGTIGNSTAVVNNEQIVASVSAGVAQAVAAVMRNVDFGTNVEITGDMAQFFRAMRREASRYTTATGQPAFPV